MGLLMANIPYLFFKKNSESYLLLVLVNSFPPDNETI